MAPRKPKQKGKAHSTDQRPLFKTSAAPLQSTPHNPPPLEFASSSTSRSAKPNGEGPSTDQPRPSSPSGSPSKFPPPNPPLIAFGAPAMPGNATSMPDFKFDPTPTEGQFKRFNDLLMAENRRLKEANEKYHKDNTKCYGDVQSLTQSYRMVSSTLEGEQIKNNRLENEVEKLDKDKFRLEHDFDDFKEEHDIAIDKCAAAELNEKTLIDQLRGARYLREKAEKENSTLLKQIVRAEDQMARWKKLIETLKPEGHIHDHEMLMKLGKGLAEANDMLEKAENERDRIQDACDDLQKSNEYYENDNLRLEEEKTTLYSENEQLKVRIEEFEDSNADQLVDWTRLDGERNRFEVQVKELQLEQEGIIDEHNKTIETLRQQIATITTEREDLGKQAEEYVSKQIAQITADRDSVLKDGEQYVRETNKTIESQQAEIAKLKEDNKADWEQYEKWRQGGNAMLETLTGRDEAQKKQIAQLGNSSELDASKDVEEAIAERNKMIEAKDEEIARLTDANKNAESGYNSLQKKAEEVVAERDNKIQEQASIIDDQKHELSIRDTSVSEHQVFIQANESELAALRNQSIRAAAKIESIEGINRDLQIEKAVLEEELAEVKAARNVETSNIDGPERPFDDENLDQQGGRKVEDLQEELTATKAALEAKDRAIAELRAVDRNASDQEDLTNTKDGHSAGESGPDTELQRKLAASESALIEYRAQEAAQKSNISKLQSQCIELSEDLATSKTKFEAIIQGCEGRIESQKKELAELGAANDGHLEKEQAWSDEITDLTSKLQEATNKGKTFAYQEKQLEKAIEERDATIRKHEQTIEGLKNEAQDLKAQVNVYEDERAEAKNTWKGKETKSDTDDLAKEKRRLTEEFEKRLAAQESGFQKRIDKNEDACNDTFLMLQGIQGELQKDADEVHRTVTELRQKTNDLEHELEAYRKGAKTKDDDSNGAGGPSRNELGRFSLSVSPMHLEQRGRVLQPRRRQRELWGSDSETTEDEEPIRRRSHHSSDKSIVSVQNASTQVDNSSRISNSTTQTTSDSEPAVAELAIQTKPSKRSMVGEMAMQTEPESVLDIKLAISPSISPSISNAETQTMPREKTIPLWWRLLYYFLLCLMILIFFGSLWRSESARRERAMWQAANEYTRRAVFSVQGGGGTGTWVPAWLWREPLIEMSTRQY
ncbi:MAG: hypothetical protein L6R35_002209 [Caloplaca aegaea]|nr:MAG: hypothetical protein L6R35_002209 [Caloplaca aegaea]